MALYKIIPGSGKTNDTEWTGFPNSTTTHAIDPVTRTAYLVTDDMDNVMHYAGVRLRVVGSGNLDLTLRDQDQQSSVVLVPLTMAATTDIFPFRATNFVTQRAQLELSTNVENEIFRINLIVIFIRTMSMEYPG